MKTGSGRLLGIPRSLTPRSDRFLDNKQTHTKHTHTRACTQAYIYIYMLHRWGEPPLFRRFFSFFHFDYSISNRGSWE